MAMGVNYISGNATASMDLIIIGSFILKIKSIITQNHLLVYNFFP